MRNGGSVIDWTKYNVAMKAFEGCDADGNHGLSWAEVDECEVCYYFVSKQLVNVSHLKYLANLG